MSSVEEEEQDHGSYHRNSARTRKSVLRFLQQAYDGETYATPKMIGNFIDWSDTPFSQGLTPQEPVGDGVEDVVSARASNNLVGTSIFIIGSIVPIAGAVIATGPA